MKQFIYSNTFKVSVLLSSSLPPSPLPLQYKLFKVQYMINAWNYHMQRVFVQSCISCLEKPMSTWINKSTHTRFVFCPCDIHPKGNNYHNICWGESFIVYRWEIVEGRDHTIAMGRSELETSSNMKTVSFMFWMTIYISITGKEVIIDSGL